MLDQNYSQSFEEPKKVSRGTLVGILILLLLVLGGGIWFAVKKFREPKGNTPPVTSLSTTSTAASSPSAPAVDRFPNDRDRDGIDDTKEKELGLSNRDFDTDGDGVSDSDEIDFWKTDPKKSDTDGDGFSDGYEVLSDYDPLGPGKLAQ